jgi:hypothetical protein
MCFVVEFQNFNFSAFDLSARLLERDRSKLRVPNNLRRNAVILHIYTIFHTVLSLVGIATGFVVLFGLLAGKWLDGWTKWFLITTAATIVTGFFFPFHGLTPAITLGILSTIVLAVAIYARYAKHLPGGWRWIYVVSALVALYFNVFVGIVQSFQKVPALKAMAPTQSEPPFAITQLVALVVFVILIIIGVIRFRIEPHARAVIGG